MSNLKDTLATSPVQPAATISVAVVAASWLTRSGVVHVLDGDSRLRLTAIAAAPAELALAAEAPDLIVWDHADDQGDDPAQPIAVLAALAPVLVITSAGQATGLLDLLRAGAHGVVTGRTSDAEFLAAVGATASGAIYLAADLVGQLGGEVSSQRVASAGPLSRREIETLRLIADGCTHRQVARRLGLTEETVNTYVKRIRGKLNAGNKAELTRKAIDLGYTTTHRHADPLRPDLASVLPLRRS
jgi:DNA-binding NarL/FixJ family response regulator